MVADASPELRARVALLDSEAEAVSSDDLVDRDLARFIRVFARITPGPSRAGSGVISPGAADAIAGSSRLLTRLKRRAPAIVEGPLARNEQYWVASERPAHLPPRVHQLSRASFRAAQELGAPSTKPFDVGLYTSTGIFGNCGMWRDYLRLHSESTLFPRPWTVWSLRVTSDARVAEIRSASDWAALICACATEHDGLIYPDWRAVARDYDAVHMTLRAVAAIQGVELSTSIGRIAPSHWDVESTFWMRWVFAAVEPVCSDPRERS